MFKLTIALPEEIAFEGEVEILNIVTSEGQVGIMAGHVPIVDVVKAGVLTFKDETGSYKKMAVSGGWLFVWNTEVTVYVNSSEFDYEIDIEEAMKQKAAAEAELSDAVKDGSDAIKQAHAKAALEKAINRINVGSKR
ncbi:MAG: ATP synthase F1 subunit epsilon [Coprobacillus sp.]